MPFQSEHTPTLAPPSHAPPCPVCASPLTAYMRAVPTRRTARLIALYGCLDCRSFFNPSGYRETPEQCAKDLQWGLSVADRNYTAARRLLRLLRARFQIKPRRIVEVGCGIGTFLQRANDLGMAAIGYDVNPSAVAHAQSQGLDARAEVWTARTALPPVDLFLSISVVEHLDAPRPLLRDLCEAAAQHQAWLFVSAPFVDRDKWHFVLDPVKPGTPFLDNDVHVTHFSTEGMRRALSEFGLDDLHFVSEGLSHGFLARRGDQPATAIPAQTPA